MGSTPLKNKLRLQLWPRHLPALALGVALLTSCGGGGSATQDPTLGEVSAQQPTNPTNPTTGQQAPTAPINLSAAAGAAQVKLSWKASPGATQYKIKRVTLDASFVGATPTFVVVGTSASTSFTDTSATLGTDYMYAVSAENSAGESPNSEHSCSAAAAAGTTTAGVRPRVFMAMHGSQQLANGTPQEDSNWAMVRSCLDGVFGNNAGIDVDTRANLMRKLNTRSYMGIVNANSQASEDTPTLAPLTGANFTALEKSHPDIVLKRNAVAVYSLYPELWDKLTLAELRAMYVDFPNQNSAVTRNQVFSDVFVGYALRGWQTPTMAPLGALSTPGAVNAFNQAGGTFVECIGGLCGSGGSFGDGFLDLLRQTHDNGKPFMMFVSRSPNNTSPTGWLADLQRQYNKASALGLWRADDIVMLINYQGNYPAFPMTNSDGTSADTVTGMLHWVMHQQPSGPSPHHQGWAKNINRTRSRSSGVSTPGPGALAAMCTAMRWPCQRARSCSSDSATSMGAWGSLGNWRKKPTR
jgi:hypothetical protein